MPLKNYRRTIARLQRALLQHGRQVKLSSRQFYSEEQNRFIDYYVLTDGKTDVLKTSSLPSVMVYLAEEYKKVVENAAE